MVNDGKQDSNIAIVTVNVGNNTLAQSTPGPTAPANTPPSASKLNVTTARNAPITITLAGSDPDANTNLVASIVSGPSMGTLSKIDQTTGSVVYTPKQDITGFDVFTFKLNDGIEDSNIADVNIVIEDGSQGGATETENVTKQTENITEPGVLPSEQVPP